MNVVPSEDLPHLDTKSPAPVVNPLPPAICLILCIDQLDYIETTDDCNSL